MKHVNKKHFSHEHILTPLQPDDEGEEITCNGCKEEIYDEPFYGCIDSKFCLHEVCSDAPRSMVHPSHPSHPLSLHQNPTYPSQAYGCNACGINGKGFCFSCAHCSFDLHITCSNLPPTFFIKEEHPHELKLVCEPEKLTANKTAVCYICRNVNNGHWMYYCGPCKVGAHVSCLCANYKDVVHEEPITVPDISDDDDDHDEFYSIGPSSSSSVSGGRRRHGIRNPQNQCANYKELVYEEPITTPDISDDDQDEFYSVCSSYAPSSSSAVSGGRRRGTRNPQNQTLEDMISQNLVIDALNAAADCIGTPHTRRTRSRNYFP